MQLTTHFSLSEFASHDGDINYFDFDESIPVNKVDEENLFWLDEENAQYEECQ